MKLGTLVRPKTAESANDSFRKLAELGFEACQLAYKPEVFSKIEADTIRAAADNNNVEISAHFLGFRDQYTTYDLYWGYLNNGISSPLFQKDRLEYLIRGLDFVNWLGIEDMIIHAGFIPNNPFDKNYQNMVACVRILGNRAKSKGINILFETGAESPVTLLRLIKEADTGNLYVNLDTGNSILYGYTDPIAALYTLGSLVRNIHVKDALPPSDCYHLGEERALGNGIVDFHRFVKKLKEIGYDRYLIIEREITGTQQIEDILHAKAFLEKLL
ncbi:MAG: sugar phosphate isomerase/epimerase family protein [Christensenellales bacterium]|jgi:L-ribulose-5-phosphate 3-epimerase